MRGSRATRGARYKGSSHRPYTYYRGATMDKNDYGSGDEDMYTKEIIEKTSRSRDGGRLLPEDSRVSKQLRRISKEDNAERYLDLVEQLQDCITLGENIKYVRRNAELILECLFDNLQVAPSKACKWELAQCIGQIGHVMKSDIDRFIEVVFNYLEKWKHKEHKIAVFRCLLHLFSLDSNGYQLNMVGDKVLESLHSVLEKTDSVEIMVAIVDILQKIHSLSPSILTKYFQDIVDILVGWHIDHLQPPDVINYVSLALQSFTELWLIDVSFALTLLSQFVEDMEDYSEEPLLDDDEEKDSEEDFSVYVKLNAKKVAAFISAFTTVLRCLAGESNANIEAHVSQDFLLESLQKMLAVAGKIFQQCHEETILNALNQLCVVLLLQNVKNLLDPLLSLLEMNKQNVQSLSFTTQISLLLLTRQIIEHLSTQLEVCFIGSIFGKHSFLRKLRMSPHSPVWQSALRVYHAVFALKNIPLLQEGYKYVLWDLQKSYQILVPGSPAFAPPYPTDNDDDGVQMDEKEAEIIFSYHIVILADVANTRNSIITMWALKPSLVELLGTHLFPASPHLAQRHPQVQKSILYLLYSHSLKHSHYISSSSLVVGGSAKFIPSTLAGGFTSDISPFSSSSSTSENLSTLLTTITAVLKLRKIASADVLMLCIEWAMLIIIGCENSLPRLMQKSPFKTLLSAIVNLGYHFLPSVSLSVVQCLISVLSVLPFNQMHCLGDIAQLCFYNINHSNDEIRKSYFELLSSVPLSTISSALNMHRSLFSKEYSSNKGDSFETIELCNIDCKTINSLQRHYFLQPNSPVPATAIHTIMSFLLGTNMHLEENWMEDIFTVCQRVDRMNKVEDWSFSILAPHSRILQSKWIVWEAAQYCVANKLKTTLGKPGDTFTNIESAIRHYAKEATECGVFKDPSREDFESNEIGLFKQQQFLKDLKPNKVSSKFLSVILLVEFIDALEKVMFNASDGCAVAPQPFNKSVRIFFTTNRHTCFEWLNRIRTAVMTVALNTCQFQSALRHSYKLLKDLDESNNTQGVDFERALCYSVKALTALKCPDQIYGLFHWAKKKFGRGLPWVKSAALVAADRHQKAFYKLIGYVREAVKESDNKLDESSSPLSNVDPFVLEFITSQVLNCLVHLNEFQKFKDLFVQIQEVQKTKEKFASVSGDLNFLKDTFHIRALSKFDSGSVHSALMEDQRLPLPADLFQQQAWPLWRRMQNLERVLLRIFSSFSLQIPDAVRNIEILLSKCEDELDELLQLLQFSAHPLSQMRIMLSIQILSQLKSSCQNNSTHLLDNWEGNVHSVPHYYLNSASRWSKLLKTYNQTITNASITKLDLFSIKKARKQENFQYAEDNLLRLVNPQPKTTNLAKAVLQFPTDAEFTILTSKLHRESAKLLMCTGEPYKACEILANIVTNLNRVLSTLANQDPSLLSLPMNESGEICARSLLTLHKWWNLKEKKDFLFNPKDPNTLPSWVGKTLKVYYEMNHYISDDFKSILNFSHPILPPMDEHMGYILTLAAIQCPSLGKVWYHLASWAFKWGRNILNHSEGGENGVLHLHDTEVIQSLLTPVISNELLPLHLQEVIKVLGGSSRRTTAQPVTDPTDEDDEDLRLEEIEGTKQLDAMLNRMLYEWGVDNTTANTLVPELMDIRHKAMKRDHALLIISARAYFKFLKFGCDNSPHTNEKLMATLRLLGLIVKHAPELQDVLEKGLSETPTGPWKTIIPQLFARLSHPEPYIRGCISDLLCRLAKDSPHLIIFPAVVGSSGTMSASNQTSFSGMFDKYFHEKKHKSKSEETEDEEYIDEDKNEDYEEEEMSYAESSEENLKKTLMQNCFSTLVNTLKKQVCGSITDVQTLIHELRRITVLWDELWLGTLSQHHAELNRKCHQLKSDIAKLNRNVSLTLDEKQELIKKKYEIVFKPLVFVLDQVIEIISTHPETPHEKNFQDTFRPLIDEAREALISPKDVHEPSKTISKLKQLHQILQQRAQKRSSSSLKMAEVSPTLANLTNTNIAMPGVSSSSGEAVTIASVGSTITVLPTKTKPKKLSFQGSDGKRYTYLFKGLEDLHLDQRIMQFLATVNTMFTINKRCPNEIYRAHYYSVVPLGARSGLIQWVGNATPLFGLYKRYQQRDMQIKALKTPSTANVNQITQIPRPSDLFYGKLTPKLKEAGIPLESRKEWPPSLLKEVFLELVKETPSDLLARELWQTSINSSEWWNLVNTYSISTAVMSIIGYIIGLGDRHLDNLLVNLTSGEVVHIDYNVCFEKGKNLRVPEKVPYRMTQNLENALGVSGVEGVFRSSCEHVLRTMRDGRETLLTLLEAFIYDPLVDWTPDSEAGYAGAVYGGDQNLVSEVRLNRQHLEKSLTVSMFTVRLTEMKADWMKNKGEVLEVIPAILSGLEMWQNTHQSLAAAESRLQEGHYLMAMIKEAEANPQHTLYGLLERYKEHTIVKQTIENANELLFSKMNELKNMRTQFQVADRLFKGNYIGEIRSKLMNTRPFMSTVAPVKDYITTAGQVQLANQCEQVEVEIRHSLSQLVSVTLNALEPLSKYKGVWLNYPANHLEKHRISRHYSALSALYDNLSLENVQHIISKNHQELTEESMMESQLVNIENYLHSKSILVNNQLQKLYDHLQEEGLSSSSSIVNTHQECLSAVHAIATEQKEGVPAVLCALLNSLSQSLGERLREDKALATTGENLSELKIGSLWWFSESIASLGMISELVSLLTKYSPPSSTSETAVIKALTVLQEVFLSLQDLIVNTSQIITVEGGKLFWLQDPSVLNIASRLQEVITKAPTSIATLNEQLMHHLRMTVFRMTSSYENSVEEANNLHRELYNLILQMTDTSVGGVDGNTSSSTGANEMTQGQMLLMGFHLLFETVDNQIDRLVDTLAAAPLPHPWPRVDTIILSTDITGHVFNQSLWNVVRAILRVKKVQAITSFFTQALQLFTDPNKCYTKTFSVTEEEQLCRIVRGYAGECIFRLLLGLPSYLATHLLLIHIQKLGVDVTGYIECHDVGTEGRVPLEGLVEEALDRCITQNNLQSVITTAASTVTNYFTATRKKLILRQWEGEIESSKLLLQRLGQQHIGHYWYHEEKLKQRTLNLPLQPNRSTVIGELRKSESASSNLIVNISELREKYNNLTSNILHRLKWAAGSNPLIAQAVEDFEKSIDNENIMMDDILRLCEDVQSLCHSSCYYETLRITSVEALSEDNHFTTILNKTQESCMLVQRYPGSISSQEELLIMLCPLPEEITASWVQESGTAVSDHLSSLTDAASDHTASLKKIETRVQSSVEDLRHCLTVHHKLISDVRVLLKSLAKFEQEGGLQGIDGYLTLYRRYSEIMSGVVRQLHHDSFVPEKVLLYIQKLQQLLIQTYVIYDKLVEFGTECAIEEEKDKRKKENEESSYASMSQMLLKRGSNVFSRAKTVTPSAAPSDTSRNKSHPLTGKVVKEHNAYALNVWRRVKTKLEGRDPNPNKVSSVYEQVDYTINEACSISNLSTLYEGWTPWV